MTKNQKRPSTAPQTPGIVCHFCGQIYGFQSIHIHRPKCEKRWEIEQQYLPQHIRVKPPQAPSITLGEKFTREELENYNTEATNVYLSALNQCPYCGVARKPRDLRLHMETCSQKYKSTAKIDNSKKFPWIKCEQCGVYVSERSIAYHKKYCERKSPEKAKSPGSPKQNGYLSPKVTPKRSPNKKLKSVTPRYMQAIRKEKEEPLSHIQVTLVPAKIKKSSKIKYIDTREAGDIFNRGKPYGVEDSIKPLMNVLSFLTVPELVNVQLVCKNWRKFATDKCLWAPLANLYFGVEDEEKLLKNPYETFKQENHRLKYPEKVPTSLVIDNFRIFNVSIVWTFHKTLEAPIEFVTTVASIDEFRRVIRNNRQLGLIPAELDRDDLFDVTVYDPTTDGYKTLNDFGDHKKMPKKVKVQVIKPRPGYHYNYDNLGENIIVEEAREMIDLKRILGHKALRDQLMSDAAKNYIPERIAFQQTKFITVKFEELTLADIRRRREIQLTIETIKGKPIKRSPGKKRYENMTVEQLLERKQKALELQRKTQERIAELKRQEEEKLERQAEERRKLLADKLREEKEKNRRLAELVRKMAAQQLPNQ